jgi:iron complex outermembrane receptor protein
VPYIEPAQNATSLIKAYSLLNGRLTLGNVPVGNGQFLRFALWGKNLLDKEYRINTIPFGIWTASYFGDPRTYGVEASYDF